MKINNTERKSTKKFLIAFLVLTITASFIVASYYGDFFGRIDAFLNNTSNVKYPSNLIVQNIEDLNGLFTDEYDLLEYSDNSALPLTGDESDYSLASLNDTVLPSVTTTLQTTNSPTTKPTNKPTNIPTIIPTSIPRPSNTALPTTIPPTLPPTTIPTRDYSKPWPVAVNCPVSTQNCVPCYLGESLCRIENGETRGFKGWACQNNNPGNIRPINNYNDENDFRNRLIKAMGGTPSCGIRTGTGGSYMVFKDYNTGFNSLKAYIGAINAGMHSSYVEYNPDGTVKGTCGNCSLTFFMNKWANNPSEGYKQTISGYLGVDPNATTLSNIVDSGRLNDFANAIKLAEGFIVR